MTSTTRFAIVPEWVLYADVSPRAIQLYAVLCRHADSDDGTCYPSRRRLAETMRCSPDTVDRALAELRTLGAIETNGRRRSDGSQTSNEYRLLRDPPDLRHPLRTDADPPLRTDAAPMNESQLEREEDMPQTPDEEIGFDEFWSAYPRRNGRRVGKKATLRRWRKLSLEERRDAYRAARSYAAAVARGDTIAKDPERFINSNRVWEDWLEPAADVTDGEPCPTPYCSLAAGHADDCNDV